MEELRDVPAGGQGGGIHLSCGIEGQDPRKIPAILPKPRSLRIWSRAARDEYLLFPGKPCKFRPPQCVFRMRTWSPGKLSARQKS